MQEKIDQAFEGWIEKSVGDGIGESYVEYLKDNLICSVYSRVNYNKDELMKPAYSDEKDSNKKKGNKQRTRENFHRKQSIF